MEAGGHEQEEQNQRADDHPEEPLILVGIKPVAVDRLAAKRVIRQTEPENLLELVARESEKRTPEIGPSAQAGQLRSILAARKPGGDGGRGCQGRYHYRTHRDGEKLADSPRAHNQAQAADENAS